MKTSHIRETLGAILSEDIKLNKIKFCYYVICTILLVSCNFNQGSVTITSDNIEISKLVINSSIIDDNNGKYFHQTGYGEIRIDIYIEGKNSPTVLKLFHENNWFKSKIVISKENDFAIIKYKESFKSGFETYKVRFGETLQFSWL